MEYIKYTVSGVIGNYSTNFNKEPLISRWGKPYKNCKVTFNETGTKQVKVMKWDNIDVVVGDTFTGKIVDKEFNGNTYSELEVPKKEEVQANELNVLRSELAKVEKRLVGVEQYIENHSMGRLPSDFSAERVDARKAELETLKKPVDLMAKEVMKTSTGEAILPEDIPNF